MPKVIKRIWSLVSVIAVVALLAIGWFKWGEPWYNERLTIETIKELESERVEAKILNRDLITFRLRHRSCEGERDAIVFVHGYSGHPVRTWGETFRGLRGAPYDKAELAWLRCLDAISVSYPTGLARGASIDGAASRLKDILDRHVMREEYGRVYVVAHSMGGLVVQRALLDILKQGDPTTRTVDLPRIKAIAYLDTPHDGLPLRDGAGPLAWLSHLEAELDELAADSEFRHRLHLDWVNAFETEPALARRFFIERAWIFEADETTQALKFFEGLKYKHFTDPVNGRKAISQTLAGETHTSLCKTNADDLVQGRGYFHDLIVPLLGRHDVIAGVGKKPWGLSRSADGEWIYVTSQNESAGGVKRIRATDRTVDGDWEVTVGERVHDFVEVETGSGRIGVATDRGKQGKPGDNGITLVDLEDGEVLEQLSLPGRPDDLDAYGNLVVVSDSQDGHVWLFDAEKRKVVSKIRLEDSNGVALQILGVEMIRGGRQVLAAGHRCLNCEAYVFLLEIRKKKKLKELSRALTRESPAEIRFLESKNLACTASWRDPGAVVCHPVEAKRILAGGLEQRIEFTGSVKPAALAAMNGGESLFLAGQDGTVKRVEWLEGGHRVSSYEHGGQESWAVEIDARGRSIYVTNGASGTVVVLDNASRQWVVVAEG